MFDPVSAAAAGGLAAAAGERVGLGAALCGADVGDAAALCVGVRERVAVGCAVGLAGAGLDVAVATGVALGGADAPASVAHAFVSWVSTARQTERAPASQAVPSVAVRENATRMKG